MALGRYTEVARGANGDLTAASEVAVYEAGTSDLAEVWQDDAGTVPARNPVITDVATGAWSVVAEAGLYDLAYPDGAVVASVPIAAAAGGDAGAVAWDDVTDKPETFPPVIGATAADAVAGNDARLSVAAAGTASVRAIGATGTTAAAGNHGHANGLMTSTAPAIVDSDAADAAELLIDFNALLAALRGRGVIT